MKPFESSDQSVVVFGSLARRELTPDSDLDWSLLLDGSSSPEDLETAHDIRAALEGLEFKAPGQEQTFATLVSSHDLINYIGGQDDTNANTTRRILLLLESTPICRDDAYNRVVNNLFKRYLSEDYGLWHGSKDYKVPRFFLNDIARYWRMMAVDFAYKQRARNNKGFALRNIKLRFSRKLIFLVGLMTCFECHLAFSEEQRNEIYGHDKEVVAPVIEKIRECVAIPPLDLLARVLLRYPEHQMSAKTIFGAYEEFIGLLACETKRQRLERLKPKELDNDEVFRYGRDISHSFQNGIRDIFLKPDNVLGKLTIEYGVF
ncbi:MAG TPA: nucleotidyltransferase domain-containing protein [Acidobacteriaceae bacterium]|nr:nucleotidyltransferase domain-containing protein [Acidobacteriaceae bacterium]